MGGWVCQSLRSHGLTLNLCHQPSLSSLLLLCTPLVAKITKPLSVKYEHKSSETKSLAVVM